MITRILESLQQWHHSYGAPHPERFHWHLADWFLITLPFFFLRELESLPFMPCPCWLLLFAYGILLLFLIWHFIRFQCKLVEDFCCMMVYK